MILLTTACGGVVGLGLYLLIRGVVGDDAEPRAPRWNVRLEHVHRVALRLGLALMAGVLVGLVTRWPVAAAATLVLAFAAPSLLGGDRARQQATERREALAGWTEMLRDTLEAGRGLETAIAASAPVAPVAIRVDVQILAAELRTPARLDDALRRFATRVDDPTCDRVIAGLLLRRRNETLGEVLTTIARQAREDVELRRRNDVEQGRVRWTARTIVAITAAMAFGLALLDRDYLAPYDGVTGQLVLCIVGAMLGAGYWSIGRLAEDAPSPRLLVGEEPRPW